MKKLLVVASLSVAFLFTGCLGHGGHRVHYEYKYEQPREVHHHHHKKPRKPHRVQYYDKRGRYDGHSVRRGNHIKYYDRKGRYTGKSVVGKHSVKHYDKRGKYKGKGKRN